MALRSKHFALAGLLAPALLAGCASTQLDAQWTDPQFTGTSLRGARVLVACESPELVLKQICEDRVSAELVARGATPMLARDLVTPNAEAYANAARAASAAASLVVQLSVADVRSGSPVSIGLGGFGFGSGGFGAGVGVSVPVGASRTAVGYAANGRLTQAVSGRVMWTGRAIAPPSGDPAAQLDELAKAVLGGAEKAGFF
jgi:hypothetical protein